MKLKRDRSSSKSSASEANYALDTSRRDLQQIRAREPIVETLVHDIMLIHQRNHFAEHITELITRPAKRGG